MTTGRLIPLTANVSKHGCLHIKNWASNKERGSQLEILMKLGHLRWTKMFPDPQHPDSQLKPAEVLSQAPV